jgi:putative endonuclease
MGTKELGDKGEKLACEYLVKNGYKIIGKNYRITFGEIDIIAKKKGWFADKTIHFVEVKTLSGNENIYPEEHVDRRKQVKLKQLAEIWLSQRKYPQDIPYQIDIIAVSITGDKSEIKFFENVVGD